MAAVAIKQDHHAQVADQFRDYVKLPRSIAVQFRKFIAERATGSFEIHVVDGVVKTAKKTALYRASDEE